MYPEDPVPCSTYSPGKPTLVVIDADEAVRGSLRYFFQDDFHVVAEGFDEASGREAVARTRPEVVLVDIDLPDGAGFALIEWVAASCSERTVLALIDRLDADRERAATAVGARDFVVKPLVADEVLKVVARVANRQRERRKALERSAQGGFWVFDSASGGCGQTTLVLAMANELRSIGKQVVVVDANLLFADACFYLGLDRQSPTVEELLASPDRYQIEVLEAHLKTHRSGIRVLAEPRQPARACTLDRGGLAGVILALGRIADHVLVDLPPGLEDWSLPLLDAATFVFPTTTGSLGGLKNLRALIELFQQVGIPAGRIRPLVITADGDDRDLVRFDRILGKLDARISCVFPADREAVERAIELGEPVTRSAPRSPFTQAVRAYLAPILEGARRPEKAKRPPGLLARLFG